MAGAGGAALGLILVVRRCIIHIGHAKTATTYLQHCMHLNQALLARHGVWVPSDFTAFGHGDLAALSESGSVICGNLNSYYLLHTIGPADRIPELERALFADPDMPAGADLLLSSETMFYYVNALGSLFDTARRYGYAPELAAYLDRQDRAAIAGYLQNVRCHGYTGGVIDFLGHDPNIAYFRYVQLFDRLAARVPGVPIRLCSFDRQFLHQGDIWSDFVSRLGIPIDPADCRRPRVAANPGLVLEQYEALRAAQLLHLEGAAGRLPQLLADPAQRERTWGWFYRPAVHDYLARHYLSDNQVLLDRYMPDADAAQRDWWQRLASPPPTPPLDIELLGRLLDQVLAAA